MINKIISKFKKAPQKNYSWIICHTRATDHVYFGPFKDYAEVDSFYNSVPQAQRIQYNLQIMISPNCPPDQWWHNPLDKLVAIQPELFKDATV